MSSVVKTDRYILLFPDFYFTNRCSDLFEHGGFCMNPEQYENMKKQIVELPLQEKIPFFTKKQCAELFDFELPEVCTKSYAYDPYFNKRYLITDAPEEKGILEVLEHLVIEYKQSNDPVQLIKVPDDAKVTIYLDIKNDAEWRPLYKTEEGYELLFSGGYGVKELGN